MTYKSGNTFGFVEQEKLDNWVSPSLSKLKKEIKDIKKDSLNLDKLAIELEQYFF